MDLSQFTSYIQLFSSFLVALTGLIAALCALIKPIRSWISGMFKRMQADEKLEQAVERIAAQQGLMKTGMEAFARNAILQIYHKAEEQGYLRDWDRENYMKMYAAYTALGGNSFVHSINEIIMGMPSAPQHKVASKPARKRKTNG